MNLLFALFVAVQLAVLFGGDGYVRATAALTYAEYARSGFAQLVAVAALTLAVAALAFWVSDPDRRIAAHNVERFERTGRIDTRYLGRLSADAVPVLARLPARLRDEALGEQRRRLARGADGLAGANLARAKARDRLAALP